MFPETLTVTGLKRQSSLYKTGPQFKIKSVSRSKLNNSKRRKYFRIVADVYADNQNLAKSLIKAGLGVPYYGKPNQKTGVTDWFSLREDY